MNDFMKVKYVHLSANIFPVDENDIELQLASKKYVDSLLKDYSCLCVLETLSELEGIVKNNKLSDFNYGDMIQVSNYMTYSVSFDSPT